MVNKSGKQFLIVLSNYHLDLELKVEGQEYSARLYQINDIMSTYENS